MADKDKSFANSSDMSAVHASSSPLYHSRVSPSSTFIDDTQSTRASESNHFELEVENEADLEGPWTDLELSGIWGHRGLEMNPWPDDERPLVRLKKYAELKLAQGEMQGKLTYKVAAACASYLDRCPTSKKYVICKYNLSNKLLRDISLLKYFHYVQYLDLSWNELADLKPLGQMPFLMYLNASHNQIVEVLDFKAPFYLTYVDLSFNLISEIRDIADFWSIVSLDLSHNQISEIQGLESLKYLRHLNLGCNSISIIENLNHMPIQTLSLQYNRICDAEFGEDVGLHTLRNLKYLKLQFNHLSSLNFFEKVDQIQSLNLRNNRIVDLLELHYLKGVKFLTCINLLDNPVKETNSYLKVCLEVLPHLMFLDGDYIDAIRRPVAHGGFATRVELCGRVQTAETILLKNLNFPSVPLSVFPYTNIPPQLVALVGPSGGRRSVLIKQLIQQVSRVVMGVMHTTRPQAEDDQNGKDFYFITRDKFSELAQHGRFLYCFEYFGQSYGLAESELEKVVNGEILMFYCDMNSALCLFYRNMHPMLVLAMPRSQELHSEWFRRRYYPRPIDSEPEGFETLVGSSSTFSSLSDAPPEQFTEICGHSDEMPQEISSNSFDVTGMGKSDPTVNIASTMAACLSETFETGQTTMDSQAVVADETESILTNLSEVILNEQGRAEFQGIAGGDSIMTSWTEPEPTEQPKLEFKMVEGEDSIMTSLSEPGSREQPKLEIQTILKKEDDMPKPRSLKHRVSVTFKTHLQEEGSLSGISEDMDVEVISPPGERDVNVRSVSEAYISSEQRPLLSALSNVLFIISKSSSSLAVQDVTEQACDKEVLEMRQEYFNVHLDNPGLFSRIVFTDEVDKSIEVLKELIHFLRRYQKMAEPDFDIRKDPCYNISREANFSRLLKSFKM